MIFYFGKKKSMARSLILLIEWLNWIEIEAFHSIIDILSMFSIVDTLIIIILIYSQRNNNNLFSLYNIFFKYNFLCISKNLYKIVLCVYVRAYIYNILFKKIVNN